jgi:OOP family OmpA-OmpF porin
MRNVVGWMMGVAVTAMLAPAVASAENFYAAVRGGVGWTQDTRSGRPGREDVQEFETTWSASAAVGRAFPFGLRVEGELGLFYVPVKRDGGVEVDGSIKNYLVMANAYYDLKLGAFKPFVGVGLGGARVNDDREVFANGLGTKLDVDETRTAFAYQARAGIAYELSQLWDLTAGYRYLHIDGGHRDTAVGRVNLGQQNNHSFEFGYAIKF